VAVDSSGERRHPSVAEASAISVLALRQPYTLARVAGMRRSSTAVPRTWRNSPKAFSIVGAPTSSAAIFDTHPRIADVFTSTTATSPHWASTRPFHAQDLLRDTAERAHAVESGRGGPFGRRAGRTEVAHGSVERDQPVASAPVIWLGVRLSRANRMLDDLLDELRIDATPTTNERRTHAAVAPGGEQSSHPGWGRWSGVGVLTVVGHQNLVRAEGGFAGCGLGRLGSPHSPPMTGVANRATSPNTVTTHTKDQAAPAYGNLCEVSCVSNPPVDMRNP
jgi:hypothetical protein